MSIINTPPTPPTPPTLSLAQRQAQKIARIKSRNTQLFNQIVASVQANFAEVWADPDQTNFSAQQVFDLLGVDGGSLIDASSKLCDLVNGQKAETLPTAAPKSLTVGNDGKVTVGT